MHRGYQIYIPTQKQPACWLKPSGKPVREWQLPENLHGKDDNSGTGDGCHRVSRLV